MLHDVFFMYHSEMKVFAVELSLQTKSVMCCLVAVQRSCLFLLQIELDSVSAKDLNSHYNGSVVTFLLLLQQCTALNE